MIENTTPEAEAAGIEVEDTTGALIPIEAISETALFVDGTGIDTLLAEVRRQTQDIVPDTSTEKGRKQIRSLAFRVSRTKTALEAKGKEFTEARRSELKAIDANRRTLSDALDAIRDATRKPLDDWEAEEAARQQALVEEARREAEAREAAEAFARETEARIAALRGMPALVMDLSLEQGEELLAKQEALALVPEAFGDRFDEATQAREAALAKVRSYLSMQRRLAEAEAAETRRQAEAKAAAEEAERRREAEARAARERHDRLTSEIQGLQTTPIMAAAGKSVDEIRTIIAKVEATRDSLTAEYFGDLLPQAQDSCQTALRKLAEAVAAREEQDREAALRERRAIVESRIQRISDAAFPRPGASIADLQDLVRRAEAAELDPADFDDRIDEARTALAATVIALRFARDSAERAQAEREELARLQAAEAERKEREAQEAEERKARETAARKADYRKAVRAEVAGHIAGIAAMQETVPDPQTRAQLSGFIVAAIEDGQIPRLSLSF